MKDTQEALSPLENTTCCLSHLQTEQKFSRVLAFTIYAYEQVYYGAFPSQE